MTCFSSYGVYSEVMTHDEQTTVCVLLAAWLGDDSNEKDHSEEDKEHEN